MSVYYPYNIIYDIGEFSLNTITEKAVDPKSNFRKYTTYASM